MGVVRQLFETLAPHGAVVSTRSEGPPHDPCLAAEANLSTDAAVRKAVADGRGVVGISEGVFTEAVANLPAEQGLPRRVARRDLVVRRARWRRHNVQPTPERNVAAVHGIVVGKVMPQPQAPDPESRLRESCTGL